MFTALFLVAIAAVVVGCGHDVEIQPVNLAYAHA